MGVYHAPLPLPEKICQIIITSAAGKATIPPKINAIASPSPLNIVFLTFPLQFRPAHLVFVRRRHFWTWDRFAPRTGNEMQK